MIVRLVFIVLVDRKLVSLSELEVIFVLQGDFALQAVLLLKIVLILLNNISIIMEPINQETVYLVQLERLV